MGVAGFIERILHPEYIESRFHRKKLSTLKMEVVGYSEEVFYDENSDSRFLQRAACKYQTTRRHIMQDSNLHTQSYECDVKKWLKSLNVTFQEKKKERT